MHVQIESLVLPTPNHGRPPVMFRESAVERRGDLIPVAGSRRYSIPGIAHVRNTQQTYRANRPVVERKISHFTHRPWGAVKPDAADTPAS